MFSPANITTQHEGRKERRANVTWRGRVMLAQGRTVDVRIRDISNSGVGFLSPEAIPSNQLLSLAMEVPMPDDIKQAYHVTTTFKTAYAVLQGHDYRVGATWDLQPAAGELIKVWVKQILRG